METARLETERDLVQWLTGVAERGDSVLMLAISKGVGGITFAEFDVPSMLMGVRSAYLAALEAILADAQKRLQARAKEES